MGKEVERASSKKKQIIAVRLDQAALTPALEYFLSESQWVDLAADGRETAFAKLAGALTRRTACPARGAQPRAASASAAGRGRGWRSAMAVAGLALLAAAALVRWFVPGT